MSSRLTILTERMACQELIQISAYAADRIDLVQAGGGNTSAKSSNASLYIKASGYMLRDLVSGSGVATVDCRTLPSKVQGLVPKDRKSCDPIQLRRWNQACMASGGGPRPSMEVLLHAPLGPVVLHTHPIVVNAFLCVEGGQALIDNILKIQGDYLYLPYAMPGLEIGTLLWQALAEREEESRSLPQVIFLENHGLVVHGDNASDVIAINERILTALVPLLPKRFGKQTLRLLEPEECLDAPVAHAIRTAVPERPALVCVEDEIGRDQYAGRESGSLFPDAAVYCGAQSVQVECAARKAVAPFTDLAAHYALEWGQRPRVWKAGRIAICTGSSRSEAVGVAEVWWAREMVRFLAGTLGSPRYLPIPRVHQLLTSEAEGYRQAIASADRDSR